MGARTKSVGDPSTPRWTVQTGGRLLLTTLLALSFVACTGASKATRRKRQEAFEQKRAVQERSRTRRRNVRPLRNTAERVRLDALAKELGAAPQAIDRPCGNALCTRRVLDKVFSRLDKLDGKRQGRVRVLQLGDSHIAADYITRTIRAALQDRFGDGGRGFVAIGQKARYGGRALRRSGWVRQRIVDEGQAGLPFGTSGMTIESTRGQATATFELVPEDDIVEVHYHAHPEGSAFEIAADGEVLERVQTRDSKPESRAIEVPVPMHALGGVVPPEVLSLRADGKGVKLFGVSFEAEQPGLIYDSIGPVGADAAVYLTFEQSSMRNSIRALDPDLVVLMVGGNDALAVRKAVRSLDEVRQQHVDLIDALKQHAPNAECLVWAPMDAGEKLDDGTVITKRYIEEIRDIQRETALEMGCAFWDTFASMGGHGSFGRWLDRGLMNHDMVHPRSKGGDLMGHLFARAFMNAYLGKDAGGEDDGGEDVAQDDLQSSAERVPSASER